MPAKEVQASAGSRSPPAALLHPEGSGQAPAPAGPLIIAVMRHADSDRSGDHCLRLRPHNRRAAAGVRFLLAALLAGVDEQRLILVVEDDEATRGFLADNFAADGFRVATAAGAGEGMRALEVRMPSLVVLDLALEDGSGLALLDRVRSSDGLATRIDPDVPVIVLTGRSGEADRVRSFARGADDHLTKPTCYLFPAL
jgi:CheY-like chemotaxis protein